MYASERFRRRVNKHRKELRTSSVANMESELESAFNACTNHLPQDMQHEVFDFLIAKYRERPNSNGGGWTESVDESGREPAGGSRSAGFDTVARLLEFGDYIGDVIDLLNEEYDERADPLDDSDWDFLRDLVSDHASELDMSLVNYVMRLVVEKGHL